MSASSGMNQVLAALSCMCRVQNVKLCVNKLKFSSFRGYAGNIISFSFGAGLSFTTCSYMLWISDETPLPSGKLSVFEASLVTSLLCVGCLAGNFLFVSLSAKYGRKIPLLFLAIPQIVSNGLAASAFVMINFIFLGVSR